MGLVLKRNAGQSILIGPHIKVTIEETHQSWVRVRVEAPAEVVVFRSEIADSDKDVARRIKEVN